ncbi:MAG: glycoside hydrolase family 88 protein [Clostridia bacterium]|nr:glycoside hydrolase family 88 protein [Clostridia bacterium]
MMDEKWIDEIWRKIDKKLIRVAVERRGTLPYSTDEKGVYDDKYKTYVNFWTNGFWPGLMWLMYQGTNNEEYKITAENGEKLLDGALKNYDLLDHDMGFMWHLSSGANYRITGNQQSYVRNMYAANILSGRYNLKGGYIRAWNGSDNKGYAIIDCMMNLPLLYWASAETGDDRYKNIAISHADKTLKHHMREDGSVHHIVNYNPETGEVIDTPGGQGYQSGSSWSRGQAWAIYGFTLSYIHTKEERYLNAAKRVANYFIAACCDDYLPKSDFRSPAEPVLYDSSAGLIAACGLLELARMLPENERGMYERAAWNLIKTITDTFADWSEDTDAIITHCSQYYSANKHITMVYADFFLAEAIGKLKGINTFLW